MKYITTLAGGVLLYGLACAVSAQAPASPPDESPERTELIEPFRIIDNIYFVGRTSQESSYLITSSAGHILIDPTYSSSVPDILDHVQKLGFNPKDIKLIIGTHAHSDHVDGHSLMQEMTGGDILSSAADKEVIESGGAADFRDGDWTPAEVDRIIGDGEVIKLGNTEITAHLTPGHTKGCLSFTTTARADGRTYNVLLIGGVRMAARPVFGHPKYPEMASDLAMTFEKLKAMPVDVYLGAHGYWYGLYDKYKRMKQGGGYKVFIDPEGYRKAINGWQQEFIDAMVKDGMALTESR